jgi:hypothetical protein
MAERRRRIDRRTKTIMLARQNEPEMAAFLLHEMAHAATNDYHGRKWRQEMERLKAAGAPVSAHDLEDDLIGAHLTKRLIRDIAADAVIEHSKPTISEFARSFVYNYGHARSGAELLRKYPWIRKVVSESRRDCTEGRARLAASQAQGLAKSATPRTSPR